MSSQKLIRIRISDYENEMTFSADDINRIEAARFASSNFAELLCDTLGDDGVSEFHESAVDDDTVVCLDLADVDWLSSVALNELINMNRLAKSRGLRFSIENANENVRNIFSLTRLERMFEFKPTESVEQQA